jgi:hypothetical protein
LAQGDLLLVCFELWRAGVAGTLFRCILQQLETKFMAVLQEAPWGVEHPVSSLVLILQH